MPETVTSPSLLKNIAHTILDALIIALFRCLAILPRSALAVIATVLGHWLWLLHSESRRITEINLKTCFPDMPLRQRQVMARLSLVESGKTLLEAMVIWLSPLEKNKTWIKRVSGKEYLDEALQKKRGVILLAPHLGNWELVGMFGALQGPFTAMYAPAKIGAMRKLMYAGRQGYGCKLAPTNTQGVKSLLKALRAGESIGILPDQVPEPESGLFAPFFGEPALTMTLIATLAARTGAAVICGYAKRLRDETGFELCFRPAVANIASDNLQEAVVALNQSVEACVKDCPEQYQWEYKRFRKRPVGKAKLY